LIANPWRKIGAPPIRLDTLLGDAAARVPCNASAKIARNTAELIGLGRDLPEEEITVLGGWAGDHYGIPDRSTPGSIRPLGRLDGSILDPVPEGKSMASLTDLVGDRYPAGNPPPGRVPADALGRSSPWVGGGGTPTCGNAW
jgi:hypothetical protein